MKSMTSTKHAVNHAVSVSDLAASLNSRQAPQSGWRSWVHKATWGAISPRESSSARKQRELIERVRQPIYGDYNIAVISVKGGVGKTSTTMCLGATLASLRSDRIVAIDANPDFGTLGARVTAANPASIRDLLRAPDTDKYAQVRTYTSHTPSRLEVVGSDQNPTSTIALSDGEYCAALDILRRHYNVSLTDCGTGLTQPISASILSAANCLVLVTTPALDGVKSAWTTLDWLSAHGFERLVSTTVVVVNELNKQGLSTETVHELFAQRCRAVQVIPYDPHIANGANIELDNLQPATTQSYLELAAMIADDFAPTTGRHSFV
ncbi:chromosome partitioning protein ParA [Corynebacterium sp. HMSC14B06]|nr:MinD/ParA family protein [Corynebacterium jeikeium]KAA9246290.1 MinD/ParA family protein [Corynebacterium amycolatum]MBC6769345.1 MinD/ParA family protein [Corynebacterium sp. LK15]MBC6832814.1 MinD/ParA family protein [Corynebacterium sp. LK29]OFL11807.1 chromosome partitioning protein ParA [Corynebacterium sp. HMSC063F04]OFM17973.1 chromosome partitioning protein ParA [Corynebacterium sp. HMSC077G01]OFN37720.1 chromosome partitioning protein ParA [Corynebacterium sp. HMSC077G07]OFO25640